MADVLETPQADSSPATSPDTASSPESIKDLKDYTPAQYLEWEKTGKLAEEQQPTNGDDAASSNAADQNGHDPASGNKGPKKKTVEDRTAAVSAEVTQLQEKLRLRALLREELAKTDKQDGKPDSSTASPKGDAPKAPVRPKMTDFDTVAEWEEANGKYLEELADFRTEQRVQKALEDFKANSAKEAKDAEQKRKLEAEAVAWKTKVDLEKQTRPDFEAVAFNEDLPVSPVMEAYIRQDPKGPAVLYALGLDLDEATRISQLPPIEAMEALIAIKHSLARQSGNGKSLQPQAQVSRTPPPPTTLRAGTNAPEDEEGAAIAAGDYARYEKIANARELARRQKTG